MLLVYIFKTFPALCTLFSKRKSEKVAFQDILIHYSFTLKMQEVKVYLTNNKEYLQVCTTNGLRREYFIWITNRAHQTSIGNREFICKLLNCPTTRKKRFMFICNHFLTINACGIFQTNKCTGIYQTINGVGIHQTINGAGVDKRWRKLTFIAWKMVLYF